jgi:hypothetical protein
MVFDSENDTETLMDFLVFEKPTQNAPAFDRFYMSDPFHWLPLRKGEN